MNSAIISDLFRDRGIHMEKKISNYETMKNDMADVFLKYDQNAMIQKFNLEHDEHYLYICFVCRKYRIDRMSGKVTWSEDAFRTEKDADYNETMTIYDVLCSSKEHCHLSHEWVNIGSLSSVQGGSLSKGSNFFRTLENILTKKKMLLPSHVKLYMEKRSKEAMLPMNWICFPFFPSVCASGNLTKNFPQVCRFLWTRTSWILCIMKH